MQHSAPSPPSYCTPFLANQGALFVNTQVMKEKGLDMPASVADLADPQYEGNISMIDIAGSSTAWLMVQSLVASYGKEEAEQILTDIYRNAGVHMEQSGSGPIKKVRAGEVARLLAEDPAITHVSIVHSETTSGILNDIASVARVVKAAGKTYIVDAVSSFGGGGHRPAGPRHRLPHLLGQQMHPGRAGLLLHTCKAQRPARLQGPGPEPLP